MDNLTHSLLAVALSRAGLNRVAPRATLTLLLAANAPDIDVMSALGGSLAYLRHHRGASHSLIALPLLAALVTAVVWLLARRHAEWRRSFLLAVVGVGSHLLLDFSNLYGMRPWLPFSGRWYSWDIVFIVDVWLWAALAACLLIPSLGTLIHQEIGARRGTGRAAAVAGLLFVAAWWGGRDLLHRRAVGQLEARLYGPALAPPLRVAAFPIPWSPLRWHGLVETESFYRIIPIDLGRPLDPARGEMVYKPDPSPVLEAARNARVAREFAAFARYGFARVEPAEDGHRVVFSDFRFHGQRPGAFLCVITLDRNLRVVEETFSF